MSKKKIALGLGAGILLALLIVFAIAPNVCLRNCECKSGVVTKVDVTRQAGGIIFSQATVTGYFQDGSILTTWLQRSDDFRVGQNCTYCYHTALDGCKVIDSINCTTQ